MTKSGGGRGRDGPPRPEVHAINQAIKSQRDAVEAQFGRPPEPGDPLDRPPLPPEKARAQMVHWMPQAELPHRLIYVYLSTDMIVDEDSYRKLGKAERGMGSSGDGIPGAHCRGRRR